MKIHHIGYLVKDIGQSVTQFEQIGFMLAGEFVRDGIRKVDIVFLKNGDYTIELISPYESTSVVASLIPKYKNTAYHFCYETESIFQEINRLEKKGYKVIDKPEVAPAIANCYTVFLTHPKLGLIELVEIQ